MALAKYQFRIEGVLVVNPEGWKDFELRLKRDDDISGLLVSSTNKFTFKGSGYDALKDRWNSNYNDKVNVTIDILQTDKTYLQQYKGVIVLTDVKFNLEKRTAAATIEDANFQGAIQGNKSVKTFLNAGMTKNGEQVTAITAYDLDYFNAAGVYQTLLNRKAYKLKDALDFLVRFMTDNEVKGIQSAYFDDVNNWEGISPYITTGISIRLASQDAPNISFLGLMDFIKKTHDLTFDFVTNSSGEPVMRIEDRAFFFSATNQDTIRSINDLSVQVDNQRVYSHLEVGNNNFNTTGNCSSSTRFFTFNKEDYALRGKGNIDKLLDLTTDYVTDSNAITSQVAGGTAYDEDVVIVLVATNGTQAAKFNNAAYCSNAAMYNLGFTNDKIIDRQLNSIPNSLTKYLTAATTPAKADLGVPFADSYAGLPADVVIPIHREYNINFSDEVYDLGSNYTDNINQTYYDIPFPGNFSFEVSMKMAWVLAGLSNTTSNFSSISYQIEIKRFDSTFTTLKERTVSSAIVFGFTGDSVGTIKFVERNLAVTMDCATGDRVVTGIIIDLITSKNVTQIDFSVIDEPTTFFKCLGADEDAGTYKVFDPNGFKAKLYSFEKNVSLTRSDSIRANTRNSIIINELSDTTTDKITWIEEMVNNIETGATTFTMIN